MKRSAGFGLAFALLVVALLWLALRDVRREPPVTPVASAVPARIDAAVERPDVVLADAPPDAQRDSVDVAVPPESTAPAANGIRLRVVDDERRPVAGARVETFQDTRAAVVETDAEGRAQLRVELGDAQRMRMAVDVDGHFHVRAFYSVAPDVVVVMHPAVRLRGRVLEKSTGLAVGGARIESHHSNCKGCVPDRVVSDAAGNYAIDAVPLGRRTNVSVAADGFPDQDFPVDLERQSLPHERDLALDRGSSVTGIVVDFVSGAPIGGATVEHEGRTIARTGSDGRFDTRTVPVGSTGRIDLRIGAEGYCWLRHVWNPEELTAESPLQVTLPRGVVVTGIVRDADGAPVDGLGVLVRPDPAKFFGAIARRELGTLSELASKWRLEEELHGHVFRTDSTGRFRSHGLVAHTPLVMVSTMPSDRGRFEAEIGPLCAPGETMNLDFALVREEYGTIAGRMLLNGAPVKGYVSWQGPSRRGGGRAKGDGSFVLEHVEPGPVVVTTRRGEHTTSSRWSREDTVNVAVGQRVERDFDLTLVMKPVTGRVVRTAGGSVAGLVVLLLEWPRGSQGGHRQTVQTGEDGRFVIELPDDDSTYRAIVYVDEQPFEREGIRAGDREVEIVVGPVPIVMCRAIDAQTREPLRALEVFARVMGGERYERASESLERPGADGWMRLRIPAGSYDLYAHGGSQGYAPLAREAVLIAPSGETRVELEMIRGASVELRLANGMKAWSPDHHVQLLDEDVALAIEKRGSPNARLADLNPRLPGVDPGLDRDVDLATRDVAVVRGLAPGRYRLCDLGLALVFTPEVIEVRESGANPVLVSWRPKQEPR